MQIKVLRSIMYIMCGVHLLYKTLQRSHDTVLIVRQKRANQNISSFDHSLLGQELQLICVVCYLYVKCKHNIELKKISPLVILLNVKSNISKFN